LSLLLASLASSSIAYKFFMRASLRACNWPISACDGHIYL